MSPIKTAILASTAALIIFGMVIFSRAAQIQQGQTAPIQETIAVTTTLAPETPFKMLFSRDNDFPYLITAGGDILQPTSTDWQRIAFDQQVSDLYFDEYGCALAATHSGIYKFTGVDWQQVQAAFPGEDIIAMHGFTFVLSAAGVMREGYGEWRALNIPQPDFAASGLAMLGNHNHVLLNGNLYITPDMGLGWQPLPTPGNAPIHQITADSNGDLLVVTDSALLKWDYRVDQWHTLASLPDDTMIDALRAFNGRIYALAAGRLYVLDAGTWQTLDLEGQFTALEIHNQRELWALDGENAMLWSTTDAITWQPTAINLIDAIGSLPECQAPAN